MTKGGTGRFRSGHRNDVPMDERMGWQDRDWAKLGDDELEVLYAFRRSSRGRRVSTRALVWSCTAAMLLAVVGFAAYERPHGDSLFAPAQASVIYGYRGTSTAVDARAPGGLDTVCIEMVQHVDGAWSCIDYWIDDRHVPVVVGHVYSGPCTHLRVDQQSGDWVCLSGVPQ
jgi:hypothetical protein